MFDRFWYGRLKQPFKLHFQRFGRGRQVVILLHGIASDGNFWKPLIGLLPEAEYTIIVPDLLGHGDSPKPDFIQYTTGDQARAVVRLMNKLRVRRATIVGHSMGSLVASRVGTIAPGRVARLLLYEPPLFAAVPEFKTAARRRSFYAGIYEKIAQNPPSLLSMTRVVATISRNWTKFLVSEQAWLPIERSLRNTIIKQTSFEELKNIAIQTDIIHGRLDVAVPRTGLKKALQHNPNIRFYRTTDNHGLSGTSARYLARLIAPRPEIRQNNSLKKGSAKS